MRLALLLPLTGCFLFRGNDGARCPTDRTIVLGTQEDVSGFAGCKRASGVTIRTGRVDRRGPAARARGDQR